MTMTSSFQLASKWLCVHTGKARTITVALIMITKRIVLTGASGYLGQHFLHSLITTPPPDGQRIDVIALYNRLEGFEASVHALSSSCAEGVTVCVESLDLTNTEKVKEWKAATLLRQKEQEGPAKGCADICLHVAAMSSPRACQASPEQAMAVNIPKAFFRAMKGVPIVALSTDQVYDGTGVVVSPELGVDGYYVEDGSKGVNFDTNPPANVYGKTKLKMERYLQEHHADLFIALRSSIIIGPKAPIDGSHVHDTFLHFVQSRKEQETTYFDNEYRTVLSVSHVIATLNWMIQNFSLRADADADGSSSLKQYSGIYNLGGKCRANRVDLARAVFDHFGFDKKYVVATKQTSPTSPLDISMDSRKLHQLTGFEAQPNTLKELVQLTFP